MAPAPSDRPAWIFLRGLARCNAHWEEFLEVFSRTFPEAEIETLDAAGNGTEHNRDSFHSILENVEDLRARSRFLREGRRGVSLCTISMGSMMGMKWAELYPQEIQNLVLMNASDRVHGRFYERLQPRNYLPFLSMIFRRRPLDREREVLRLTTLTLDPEKFEKSAKRQALIHQTSAANFFWQLHAASRFVPPRTKPPCSILALASTHDQLAKVTCSRRLAADWNLRLIEHPHAGHDLPLEAPDWICQQIDQWLQTDLHTRK